MILFTDKTGDSDEFMVDTTLGSFLYNRRRRQFLVDGEWLTWYEVLIKAGVVVGRAHDDDELLGYSTLRRVDE